MIRSMTGYGKGSLSIGNRQYQVEIKSVNHRYADINIKLPRELSYLEETIKLELLKYIKRGKIDVYVNYENNSETNKSIGINSEIAKVYINELKQLAKEENISCDINVVDIAKFPDVLNIQNNGEDEELIKKEILLVINEAISKIIDMKQVEGQKIVSDLLNRIDKIDSKIKQISEKSTGLISDYVVKLEKRIECLLSTEEIDKSRLAQEVVIFADKCSVEEEITRLESHIYQFRKLLVEENSPVGKKLDFIIQEMNRETNTIGSKANNLEITNCVIDIKTELEDIREQVQNIE